MFCLINMVFIDNSFYTEPMLAFVKSLLEIFWNVIIIVSFNWKCTAQKFQWHPCYFFRHQFRGLSLLHGYLIRYESRSFSIPSLSQNKIEMKSEFLCRPNASSWQCFLGSFNQSFNLRFTSQILYEDFFILIKSKSSCKWLLAGE